MYIEGGYSGYVLTSSSSKELARMRERLTSSSTEELVRIQLREERAKAEKSPMWILCRKQRNSLFKVKTFNFCKLHRELFLKIPMRANARRLYLNLWYKSSERWSSPTFLYCLLITWNWGICSVQGEVQEMTVCILSEQIFLSEVKIFLLWPKEYNSNLAKKNIFILTKRCF